MQIIASNQNENVLNLATSGSKSADSKQSGLDFSCLFSLMSSKSTQNDVDVSKSLFKRNENTKNNESFSFQNNVKNFDRKDKSSFSKKDSVKTDKSSNLLSRDDVRKNVSDKSAQVSKKEQNSIKAADNNTNTSDKQYVNENNDEVQNYVDSDLKNNQTLSPIVSNQGAIDNLNSDFDCEIEGVSLNNNNQNLNIKFISDNSLSSDSEQGALLLEQSTDSLDEFTKSVLNLDKETLLDTESLSDLNTLDLSNDSNLSDLTSKLKSSDKSLASMFDDLNVESVTITDSEESLSISDDEFGAKTFEAIEDSIKSAIELNDAEILSTTLDDNLVSDEIFASELEAGSEKSDPDTKADSEFKKSLNILKAAVQKDSESTDANGNDAFLNTDTNNTSSKRVSVESAFMFKAAKAKDGIKALDTSSAKDNSSSFNNSYQGLNAFAKAMNAKSLNASNGTNSQFSTLFMSSNLKENAQRITEQVMKMASRNLKTMNIELTPNSLGKLKISLDMTKAEDIASVSISASDKATKQLLEQGLSDLKDRLLANDIKADPKVEEYKEQENSRQNHEQKENSKHENSEKELYANDENNLFDEDNLSFENIINSQNKDLMTKFA